MNSAFFGRCRSAAVRWAVVFAVSFGGLPLAALPVIAQEKAKEEIPDSPARVLVKQARVKIAEGTACLIARGVSPLNRRAFAQGA